MPVPTNSSPTIDCIMALFEDTFYKQFNTRLVPGKNEPLYQPATHSNDYHQIIFAHGYFASALHETAHWLVAGERRRRLVDYGYWYLPDGRDQQQQAEFENVEVLPQAIEWALSVCCGVKFEVSSDNLSGIVINRLAFKKKVYNKVLALLNEGFNERTTRLLTACHNHFQTADLSVEDFQYQGMYELV